MGLRSSTGSGASALLHWTVIETVGAFELDSLCTDGPFLEGRERLRTGWSLTVLFGTNRKKKIN